MIGYAEPRKVTKIYQKDAKINDFRGLQRGSARKRTETTRCAPQARRTEARRRRANTASVAIGRQSSRATKKKLPRRRTFCRTKPAPKRPPRGQTNIARGSGHPSEANDSNLDALRARQSPLHVGDPKRSKKRLFLHVSRPVHPRAAPEDQRTACCDRGTSFGPTRPPCTERGRVDSSYVKSRYPPPSCTTWEAPKGYTEGTSIPISPK